MDISYPRHSGQSSVISSQLKEGTVESDSSLTENQKLKTENYSHSEAFVTAIDADARSRILLSGSVPVRAPLCTIQYLKNGSRFLCRTRPKIRLYYLSVFIRKVSGLVGAEGVWRYFDCR